MEKWRYFKNPRDCCVYAFDESVESQLTLLNAAIQENWKEIPDWAEQMSATDIKAVEDVTAAAAAKKDALKSVMTKLTEFGFTEEEISAVLHK